MAVPTRPAALEDRYAGYHRLLLRYLRSLSPAHAEDLAQETWLAVAPLLAGWTDDRPDLTLLLLLREGRRQWDLLQRRGRQKAAVLLPPRRLDALAADPRPEPAVPAPVNDLLEGLKPLQAEVLRLRVVAGFSAEEAAAHLGLSPGQIRVVQHRALRQLARRRARFQPRP
ncbi:MAG: hypothetical protein KGQ66_17920 [Acidobacteriota bacterium]|nr:hypothetical protein [Acidobacteriota bacterium]